MRAYAFVLLLEAGLVLAWSSGFIGAKLAAETPSVFLVLFWRFVFAAGLLCPFVLLALRRGLGWRAFRLQLVIGSLAMFVYLATGIRAIDLGVPAGIAALIGALQPLATAALAGPVLGELVGRRQWAGLVIAFAGILIAVTGSFGDAPLSAYALALLGVVALVAATLIAKASATHVPLMPALGIQSLVSAVLFLPLAAADGSLVPELTAGFVAAVAWFVVFSTIAAYGLYWLCLRRSTATRVASLIYLTPPATMVWAWLQFGEPMTVAAIVGFTLCLVGVALSRTAPRKATVGAPELLMSDSGYPHRTGLW